MVTISLDFSSGEAHGGLEKIPQSIKMENHAQIQNQPLLSQWFAKEKSCTVQRVGVDLSRSQTVCGANVSNISQKVISKACLMAAYSTFVSTKATSQNNVNLDVQHTPNITDSV